MRAQEFVIKENTIRLSAGDTTPVQNWIKKVYNKYPATWQNNHVMTWGSGDDQQFAMFELVPSFSQRGAVEVKWFQAYPLRSGVGTRAMQELQALAREDGISLTLYPWDKGQVSQPALTKFYRKQGFRPVNKGSKNLAWDHNVNEDWRKWAAGAAVAGAGALGGYQALKQPVAPVATPAPTMTAPAPKPMKQLKPLEQVLVATATQAGLAGNELKQFLAQCAHETGNFTTLEEMGGNRYLAKRYDKKYNPARAKVLGNVKAGDGVRYKGRGFIQLTGRYNYRKAGVALGLPLEQQPELVERPDIAAKVAVWFWKQRVQPRVTNFQDVPQSTKPINPALKGLPDRQRHYDQYQQVTLPTLDK